MKQKVIIKIPNQRLHDYKKINRTIRKSFFYRKYITGKSKDRHEIYMTFPDEKKAKVMIDFLKKAAEELKYEIEIEYEQPEN